MILFIVLTYQFVLKGQKLDTICDGRDGFGFCLSSEKIPDTVWMEVPAPIKISFTMRFKYYRRKTNADGFKYSNVKHVYAVWADVRVEQDIHYLYANASSKGWFCYFYEGPSVDIIEYKQIMIAVHDLICRKFVGCACKTWVTKYNDRKNTYISLKHYKPYFGFQIELYVIPKKQKVQH